MSKKLDIYFNMIIWKHTSWHRVNKYISNLRSRIYKASVQKSYKKNHHLQTRLVSSPFAKMLALKTVIDERKEIKINLFLNFIKGYLRLFHIGYIINYLGVETDLNLSTFLCTSYVNIDQYKFIIDQVKQLLITWALVSRWQESFTLCISNSYYSHNDLNIMQLLKTVLEFKYSYDTMFTVLNLNPLLHCLTSYAIITRLDTINPIKICVNKWLDEGRLSKFVSKPNSSIVSISKDNFFLGNLITLIIISVLCYEAELVLLSEKLPINLHKLKLEKITVFNCRDYLLICSNQYTQLNLWMQKWMMLLTGNGVQNRCNLFRKIVSLQQGTFFKWHFICSTSHYISIRPSLYAQFLLLKNISITIRMSKSKSILILIITLNKLLLNWSSYFSYTETKKVFCLLDYLIYLKVKTEIHRRHSNWSFKKLCSKYFFNCQYLFNHKLKNSKWILSEKVQNLYYMKTYFLIKLSWLR